MVKLVYFVDNCYYVKFIWVLMFLILNEIIDNKVLLFVVRFIKLENFNFLVGI